MVEEAAPPPDPAGSVGLEMKQRFRAACYPLDAVESDVSKHPLISSAREDTHQPQLEKVISTRVGS